VITGFLTIDYIFIALLLILSIRGAYRGFVSELLSMTGIILGLGLAVTFSRLSADYLDKLWGESSWNFLIAFLIIFLIVYTITKIFEGLMHRLFSALHLEKLDRVLGFFLGIGEGVLIIAIVLFLLAWQPFFDSKTILENSFFSRLLLPIMPPASSIPLPKVNIGNV